MANVLSTEDCISTAAALKPQKKAPSHARRKKNWAMAGPLQTLVYQLKVAKRTERGVRRTLRAMGYSPARISQLLSECRQYPPRNHTQRQRQTLQDQPQCIHDDSDRIK